MSDARIGTVSNTSTEAELAPRIEKYEGSRTRTTHFGAFVVEEVLGQGGMGIVYAARHRETNARVAIKTARLRKESHLASVRREIAVLRAIHHPGIVNLLDEGVEGDLPWYAMEMLPGPSLASFARPSAEEALSEARLTQTLSLLGRISDALACLHAYGFVHGDLKPQNIFVRGSGEPVLVDLGVSRRFGAEGREVSDLPAIGGTAAYMSPQQIEGHFLEPRDDLYSLGCIAYELLTGQPPFVGIREEVARAHLERPPVPPSKHVRGVSAGVDALVLALLAKERRDRPAAAVEVSRTVRRLGADLEECPVLDAGPVLHRPRLVGRDRQISELLARVDDLRSGRGGVAVVMGESGIGKTYLALEVARLSAKAGVRVIIGRCTAVGDLAAAASGAPLHAFRDLLLAVADRCAAAGATERRLLLGGNGPILASVEPSFAERRRRPSEVAPDASAGVRDRLLSACSSVFKRFAQQRPVLYVIDDLQWADELSWELVRLLAKGEAFPLLVLGTLRSDNALRPEQSELPTISIGRLQRQALAAVSSEMLAVQHVPERFVDALATQTEGNPFYVAEYLRTALREGIVRRTAGVVEIAERAEKGGGALPFPATVRDLIFRRLDELGQDARHCVEVAAVVGRELDAALLAAVAGTNHSATTELLQRDVFEAPVPGVLRFTHDKLREAAYDRIDRPRRRELHGSVGLALERLYGNAADFDRLSSSVARHFMLAGDTERGTHYFSKAATHALAVGAYPDAIAFLEECLAQTRPGDPRAVRWHRQLADAHAAMGNLEARLSAAHAALSAAGHPALPLALSVPRALSQLVGRAVRNRMGLHPRRSASPAIETELASAHRHVAVVHFFRNDRLVTMAVRLSDAIAHAERAPGASADLANAHAELGAWFGFAGLEALGTRHLSRAMSVAREAGNAAALSYSAMLDCLYAVGAGRFQRALDSADECQPICDRIDDRVNWGNAQIVRFWVHHYRGDRDAAERAAHDLIARARNANNQQQEIWGLTAAGLASLRAGRPDEALGHLDAAFAHHQSNDRNNYVLTAGALALARHLLGQRGPASAVARLALDAFVRGGRPAGHASLEGLSCAAEVAFAAGPDCPLLRRAVLCLRRYRRVFRVGEPRYRLWAGKRAAAAGHERAALRHWTRGFETARELSMGYDVALLSAALQIEPP